MNERDRLIVSKMLNYCREIEDTHRFFHEDKALFTDRQRGFVYRNSIAMPIMQIGELAKHLSEDFRAKNNKIPWKAVMGMRDIFAHHYGSVDYELVWKTAHTSITELENYLRKQME